MLRPRESRELRIVSSALSVMPDARIEWAQDVFGNAVATATFNGPADRLFIECVTQLTLTAPAWPIFDIAAAAIAWPFAYSDADLADLGALTRQQYPDEGHRLKEWAIGHVRGDSTDTLALLKDLAAGVANHVRYEPRETEGTQSPQHSLDRGRGSCRDLAVLFAEGARSLGFGTRLVSGYLYTPPPMVAPLGSTHAWAEVFVPGAGWITFDPTNRIVGGANLIPVAVSRDMWQATPVVGSFTGMTSAFHEMLVDVVVRAMPLSVETLTV